MKRIFSLVLALAMALSLAACSGGGKNTTAAAMHLRRTQGTVSVSDGGGKDVPVSDNLGLYSGYEVGTRSASSAWIDLDDVKLAKLDQNSKIVIEKEGKKLGIELKSGSLFFNVTEPLEDDETMEIRTSTMLVGIRGTCGWVEDNNGLSRVYILEGKVECSAEGQTVRVYAGEYAELTEGGELTVQEFDEQDAPAFVREEVDGDLPGGPDGSNGSDETPGPDDMYVYMPSVAGWNAQEALRLLQDEMGLAVDVQEEFSDTISQGYVIRFSPMEGLLVEKGDTVTIWVSKGPEAPNEPEREVVASGDNAGTNATWALYSDGTLVISGTGPMDYDGPPPWWYEDHDSILKVVVKNGITNIGYSAFMYCGNLSSVEIPAGVTSIGGGAFGDCTSLISVTIPDGVTVIGQGAFSGCSSLTSVTIPATITDGIGLAAFSGCSSLTDVYFGGSESQWEQIYIDDINDELLNANIQYAS